MGQSNFNKAAIKAKENGTGNNTKLEPAYRNVLIFIGALVVAALIFAVLVSTHVINCTNTSQLLATSVNGDKMYVASKTNKDGTAYENNFYVIDKDGKYIQCHYSEELKDVCYYDENGEEQVYLLSAGVIGENADGVPLYMDYSANMMYDQGSVKYYFFDEDGNRVDCTANEDYTKVFYKDASGSDVEFVLVDPTVSGSDVSGSDVSGSDVSAADAA